MNETENAQPGPIDQLVQSLQSDDGDARLEAMRGLGESGNAQAVPHLGNILNDAGQAVEMRREAVIALGRIGHPDAFPHLGQALTEDADDIVRKFCIAAIDQIGPTEAVILYLVQAITDPDTDVSQSAFYSLGAVVQDVGKILEEEAAIELAGRILLEDEREAVRHAAAATLGDIEHPEVTPFLVKALAQDDSSSVLLKIISVLGQIGGEQAVSALGQALINDVNPTIRRFAAGALKRMKSVQAIEYLCETFIEDQDDTVREVVESALIEVRDWRAKAQEFVSILEQGQQERQDIDALAIVRAIRPGQEMRAFTGHLVDHGITFNENHRMTAVIAALIIASAGGSTSLAGERLNAYQREQDIPENKLRMLRIDIGGATALNPLLEALRTNLEVNFQQPINELNAATKKMWADTIRFAQFGFLARMVMSTVFFIVGVYLVLDSYAQVRAGNLEPEQLVGSAVSFGGGILAMLSTVYTGPLKEIRRSVNDLGIASAAFIAYIHRVLEVSHTFSFYYLEQKMSFEEMLKSSKLIEDAMNDTIQNLTQK